MTDGQSAWYPERRRITADSATTGTGPLIVSSGAVVTNDANMCRRSATSETNATVAIATALISRDVDLSLLSVFRANGAIILAFTPREKCPAGRREIGIWCAEGVQRRAGDLSWVVEEPLAAAQSRAAGFWP